MSATLHSVHDFSKVGSTKFQRMEGFNEEHAFQAFPFQDIHLIPEAVFLAVGHTEDIALYVVLDS